MELLFRNTIPMSLYLRLRIEFLLFSLIQVQIHQIQLFSYHLLFKLDKKKIIFNKEKLLINKNYIILLYLLKTAV
jgi:hypothetical protein